MDIPVTLFLIIILRSFIQAPDVLQSSLEGDRRLLLVGDVDAVQQGVHLTKVAN